MRSAARPGARFRVRFLLAFVFALAACDGPTSSTDGGAPPLVSPRFELAADPMDFGAIPFPDDLYRDADGGVALGTLPGEGDSIVEGYPDALRRALRELSGFSTVAPVFFYFPPHSLDPGSLPGSPAASTREDSAVFLVEADPASSGPFRRRIPIHVHYEAARGQLALRPADGHPLVPGRSYAAVVTTSVLDENGQAIAPDPRFEAIRDARTRPTGALEGEAYDHYAPVLASLASNGVPSERVAGVAVFTVQRVLRDLRDARALVHAMSPPTVEVDAVFAAGPELDELLGAPEPPGTLGLDAPGGVAHQRIGWLVHGRFSAPNLTAERAGTHGRFTRDGEGSLVVKRSDEVPFTLAVPKGELSNLRIAIFQHGLGGERSEMLAIADALAASGWATIAIDIPFHGLRALGSRVDTRHRYGPGEGPDGFGDRRGMEVQLEYLGVLEHAGELPAFHPLYVRDVIRQSAVDLMSLVRVLRDGDWSQLTATPTLESLRFSSEPLAFVGVSLGGIVGTVFVAAESEVGAAVLSVTGGDLSRLVEKSAAFSELFSTLLFPRLGLDGHALDPVSYPPSFHPELALFQTLLDAGDAISFAPVFAARPVELLFQMAEHDEVVPNRATEALARAAGAALVGEAPVHTDLMRADAPLSGNAEVMARWVTRGLYRFSPATHGLFSTRAGEQRFAHPPEPPFTPIDPEPIENPIEPAIEQLVHFLESWWAGGAEIVSP